MDYFVYDPEPANTLKRFIGPLLTLLLIAGVGVGLYVSVTGQLSARRVVTVRGLIGSEKEDFFLDERVQAALRKNGLIAQVEKAGSRQIATDYTASDYDFVFPAGSPAAEKIRRESDVRSSFDVFFTPMTVASWTLIADLLEANKLVRREGEVRYLELNPLLKFMEAKTRWSDLTDNPNYNVDKGVLITSTDVRRSNSAAMYLSLMSYVANGGAVVQNDAQLGTVMPLVSPLFFRQGFQEYSSAVPFEDYLVMGPGKAPLVMVYESQFLQVAAEGSVTPEMTLLYPEPTLYTKHVLLAMSEAGEKLGRLLSTDPELGRLEVAYGFRNNDTAAFEQFVSEHGLSVPGTLVNVIDPPSYEILEKMIGQIERGYARAQNAP